MTSWRNKSIIKNMEEESGTCHPTRGTDTLTQYVIDLFVDFSRELELEYEVWCVDSRVLCEST